MNTPRPCLGPQPRLSLPKPLGLQIGGHTGWSSRGKFSLNSSPGTVSRASTVRQHTLHFGVPPRYLPAPDGYPPVGVGVGAGGGGGRTVKRSRERSSGSGGHSRVEPDFLKRHHFSRQLVFGFVHHPVRALSDLLHLLEVLHGALARRRRPPGAGPGNPAGNGPDTRGGGPGGPGELGSPSSGWNASRAQPLTICPT